MAQNLTHDLDALNHSAKHDLDALDHSAKAIVELLDSLASERRRLLELIAVWRRPGWTTPAEYLLTHTALKSLAEDAAALKGRLASLADAVQLVGR